MTAHHAATWVQPGIMVYRIRQASHVPSDAEQQVGAGNPPWLAHLCGNSSSACTPNLHIQPFLASCLSWKSGNVLPGFACCAGIATAAAVKLRQEDLAIAVSYRIRYI